jgi:hypothetical protein
MQAKNLIFLTDYSGAKYSHQPIASWQIAAAAREIAAPKVCQTPILRSCSSRARSLAILHAPCRGAFLEQVRLRINCLWFLQV